MTKLTTAAVQAIASQVLFKADEIVDGKPPADAIKAEGILRAYAFHPGRIAAAKPEIDALLSELPDNFQRSKGGGWSFLNACMDKNENHWGEHPDMEMLICLGIAVGSASWVMKDMMNILPGGMPYVAVDPGAQRAAA